MRARTEYKTDKTTLMVSLWTRLVIRRTTFLSHFLCQLNVQGFASCCKNVHIEVPTLAKLECPKHHFHLQLSGMAFKWATSIWKFMTSNTWGVTSKSHDLTWILRWARLSNSKLQSPTTKGPKICHKGILTREYTRGNTLKGIHTREYTEGSIQHGILLLYLFLAQVNQCDEEPCPGANGFLFGGFSTVGSRSLPGKCPRTNDFLTVWSIYLDQV